MPYFLQDHSTCLVLSYVDTYPHLKDDKKIRENITGTATTRDLDATYDGVAQLLTGNTDGTLVIDTISVLAGNRVLVKDQTDKTQNGIYVATT